MNRTDRLMGIITLLQSKKHQTVEQIAGHFGICARTVFRDLHAMEEIGVPVSFEPGKGYSIVQGYFLPPVSLTMEEANALAFMEPLIIRFGDKSIQQYFGTALGKIKLVLGKTQREKMEQIQAQTSHYVPDMYAHMLPDTYHLTTVQNAIIQKNILRIEYLNGKGEASEREVEPIGLTFYSLNWHLIGWCHLRLEYRDFIVLRIQKLSATMMPFRKTDHINLNEYLKNLDTLLYAATAEK